ncbi:nucleotide disphospho-sugar-binding domain-containing protein [Streptomyces sp. L2]|uniref:nucleotide disphospho-sugar-binding domain-containing protein n=1 Tax=Streptomyces sp. L2 TaxID=2162665 RepID=UPI001013B321|nr:nucleotide disphospho-sugar-binding domain-containing protein [Streptomyces sp. L2]
MRVLMLNTPVPTHFSPLLPLAWALRGEGHEVVAAVQPDVVDTALTAGLHTVSIGDPYHVEDLLSGGLPPGKRPREVRPRPDAAGLAGGAKVWQMHAKYLVEEHLAFARRYRPDLIVADMMEYSSLIVGGVLGVPVVHHRWGLDPFTTGARAAAREALGPLCRRLGLPGLPDPDVVLDPSPAALRLPDTSPGSPIRYVPSNGPAVLPDWLYDGPAADRRRVVVSLGTSTLDLGGLPLLVHVLRAFADLPDTEALATVPGRLRESLTGLPPNVRLIDPVPLRPLLDSCAAVVHHGGAGTLFTATDAGLPQLVLPQIMDQFPHGDALASAAAGLTLTEAADQDDPGQVAAAVRKLLDDPSYGSAAGGLAGAIAAMPSPGQVARDLARLV